MKKKHIIFIELIIWLLVLISVFYFFVYKTTIKENKNSSYYLFFDDAGGLVKGSPVRLMGINIGYVRDVKIFENKVFVSFLVTADNVQIPNMASATVEFYGLGGSTSLEISPKTSIEADKGDTIIPAGAYRIQDYWDGAKLSANVMIDIYGSVGRTIQSTNILNNKHWLKQSQLVKELSTQTGKFNDSQTVFIHKLTDMTKDYSKLKQIDEEKNEEALND